MEQLEFTADAAAFLAAAGDHLARDPVINTVIASVAYRTVRQDRPTADQRPGSDPSRLVNGLDEPWWFLVVRSSEPGGQSDLGDQVVGVAMRTAPPPRRPVWVQQMPERAALRLARVLVDRGEIPGGVSGALPTAEQFAAEIGRLTGRTVRTDTHTRLFELERLQPPSGIPGALRPVRPDERELANAWLTVFHAEAADQGGRERPEIVEHDREDTAQRIRDGRLWFWEDGGRPVHLTGANLPSLGVARVGPVYTPAEHRGRGYAAAAVAAVSQHFLHAGARVCLFTDQANPVSNAIYQRIGYRPVVDMVEMLID